jgi:hypothetical protein
MPGSIVPTPHFLMVPNTDTKFTPCVGADMSACGHEGQQGARLATSRVVCSCMGLSIC